MFRKMSISLNMEQNKQGSHIVVKQFLTQDMVTHQLQAQEK